MPKNRSSQLMELISSTTPQLMNLDASLQKKRPAPDKWSPQEILGHLIDSTYNNHRRFILASQQDDLIFDGYPQEHWVKAHQYNDYEWSALVTTWTTVNQHLAMAIKHLPEQIIRRPTTTHNFDKIGFRKMEKGMPSSLDFLIEDYIIHVQHHLHQLFPS